MVDCLLRARATFLGDIGSDFRFTLYRRQAVARQWTCSSRRSLASSDLIWAQHQVVCQKQRKSSCGGSDS
jgi:hypothetical protein